MAEDWRAVASAINARMAELPINQRDLSERSGVSIATIREIQRGDTSRRRSKRTLGALSESLNWPEGYLAAVLIGEVPPAGPAPAKSGGELSLVLSRLDQLQADIRKFTHAVERLAERRCQDA